MTQEVTFGLTEACINVQLWKTFCCAGREADDSSHASCAMPRKFELARYNFSCKEWGKTALQNEGSATPFAGCCVQADR